ncbi:SPW repeat protein [Methylobacterium nigriterrae]|uniref:SPW repeat protein n=1 Tax=Methylobacterium nigriterrae TaxID=3127512 RepID=UPI0030133179
MRSIENRTEDTVLNSLNVLLGVALLMTPWYLGLGSETAAARNAFASGVAIAIIAVLAISKSYDWEEYINLAIGLWVAVAPWALGFAHSGSPMWAHLAIGLAVAVLAAFELWRLYRAPEARSV